MIKVIQGRVTEFVTERNQEQNVSVSFRGEGINLCNVFR